MCLKGWVREDRGNPKLCFACCWNRLEQGRSFKQSYIPQATLGIEEDHGVQTS